MSLPRKTKLEKSEQRVGELMNLLKNTPRREIIISRDEIRDHLCPACQIKIGKHLTCENPTCYQLICPINFPAVCNTICCETHGGIGIK